MCLQSRRRFDRQYSPLNPIAKSLSRQLLPRRWKLRKRLLQNAMLVPARGNNQLQWRFGGGVPSGCDFRPWLGFQGLDSVKRARCSHEQGIVCRFADFHLRTRFTYQIVNHGLQDGQVVGSRRRHHEQGRLIRQVGHAGNQVNLASTSLQEQVAKSDELFRGCAYTLVDMRIIDQPLQEIHAALLQFSKGKLLNIESRDDECLTVDVRCDC